MSDTPTPRPETPPVEPASAGRPWTFLGRLTQAVREQNWFAVALEVVIVVVGVVIGFQVTAWGNEQAERAREQVLLRGLHADFVENRARYVRFVDAQTLTVRQARRLHALTGPSPAAPDPAEFDSLLWAVTNWTNLDPTVGRIDAVLGSGQIAIVQSDSLQAALSSWPAVLANLRENELLVADGIVAQFLPYLRPRYPLVLSEARGGVIEPARAPGFSPQRRALLSDPEFANLVVERWVNAAWVLHDGKPVGQLIEEILRLIDADLDP